MTVFDQAWNVAKDFYFDPSAITDVIEDGKLRQRRSTMGETLLPTLNYPKYQSNKRNARYGLNWDMPIDEMKNMRPLNLPRSVVYINEDGKTGIEQIASDTDVGPYTPHYVGANLSAFRDMDGLRDAGLAGDDYFDEDRVIEGIASTLLHEYGHALIDDELMRDFLERVPDTPKDKQQELMDRYAAHHEVGAYNLQFPGGLDDHNNARFSTIVHPNWSKWKGKGKIPRPYISGEGNLGDFLRRWDLLDSEDVE